jgi:hypothetical protein
VTPALHHCPCGQAIPLDEGELCERCADERAADEHDESCDCERCAREAARYQRLLRERAALHVGGLSSFGREVLGWVSEGDSE